GTQLLAAIKGVFEKMSTDRITSEALAEELAKDKDSVWSAYGKSGKPITQRQIAKLLDDYGIRPDSIRIPGHDGTKKGYLFAWLEEAFDTYLDLPLKKPHFDPEHRSKPATTATSCIFPSGTEHACSGSKSDEKPNNDGPCSGVPDRKPPWTEETYSDVV